MNRRTSSWGYNTGTETTTKLSTTLKTTLKIPQRPFSDAAVVGAYYDSDGSLFAQVSAGTETTSTLWYSSDIALVELQGPSSCNGSLIAGTGSNPYLSGNATIAIGAASLDFQDACDGYTLDFGDYSLAQGSTTVLDAGTWADVSFSETGLPSGLAWGVSIGSDKKSGDGAALSFYLPVGSYSFTLSGGVGYLPTPSATSLSFGGSGEDVSIVWELVDVSSTAGSDSIDVSQPVTFSVTLTSGSAGDSFAWTGLPGGCSASDSATVTCSPTSPSNQSIVVKVTDSDGFVVLSLPFSFQVYADPTLTTPTGSPSSIDIGQTVTFTSIASNGSGGNTFAWTGLPTGCHPVSGPTLSCTPTAVATVSITISVTDSNGYTATEFDAFLHGLFDAIGNLECHTVVSAAIFNCDVHDNRIRRRGRLNLPMEWLTPWMHGPDRR